ncbi:S41 family peptidase [Leeuwenhoekiella marinoflava]|uniref:Peptidase S41-like protein n=2 Tax=Leeuwenhoekiella marinoflava TaxID=988 RepID=A0A4Q0PIM7_9FLAO|nr:S41 family peptidase [Leeuwenhoekiella marinoflava]RXG26900.1 peptidase S41-like protein [Leeuwenhoekiella marinoflava]SHF40638.1 Peptidase family S41 [Leeuwenhoekiella marinoflava DSM 3653]
MKTALKIKISLYFLGLILLSTCSLMAQQATCACKQDLNFLVKKIKKSSAYKNDFRGAKEVFDQKLSPIASKATSQMPLFDCYLVLVETMQLINDRHSIVYGNAKFDAEMLKDEDKLAAFKETALFKMYPNFSGDLERLQNNLSKKAVEEIEGVYHAGRSLEVGVVKDNLSEDYTMIVLRSQLPLWKEGEQLGILKLNGQNRALAVIGSYATKTPVPITTGFKNGEFMSLNLKKDTAQISYWRSAFADNTYHFEQLSPEVSYIKAGDFSGFYPVLGEAEKFYEELKGKAIADNLIVDLRNNGGGGDRNSDILFEILENQKNDMQLFVLVNQNTGSNAEQFAIRLKKAKAATILGDRTKGAIAYELKGDISILPSNFFKVYLSSKRHREYLSYEGVGVKPDLYLDYSKDWLKQTQNLIQERMK